MIAPPHIETPSLLPAAQEVSCKVKSNEWYTPVRYIEAARRVMGSIDLDPASCELANRTVKAERFYTEKQNGLILPWLGRIWLNPPYSKIDNRSGIEAFIHKLIGEYDNGNVEQALLLVTVRTEAAWYQPLWRFMICFPDHILHFYKPDRRGNIDKDSRHGHFFGTSIVYLGPHEQKFVEEFSQFGTIAKRVSGPRKETQPLSLWEGVSYA